MINKHDEWMRQADYDMDTADAMYSIGRYIYAVFMCHMSIEKALKALYSKNCGTNPPKTHNLLYLLNNISHRPEQELMKFITKLNTASIATRYPDDLVQMHILYNQEVTKEIILRSKDVLQWIKAQF